MPATRASRPRTITQTAAVDTTDQAATARAIADLAASVARLTRAERQRFDVDLAIGANVINHNLGRVPAHATLMPTAADATFAWAVTARDERTITVTVAGLAQSAASLEVS